MENNEMNGFKKVIDEIIALKERKNADYGNIWRVGGIKAIFIELSRKFYRIWLNKDKDDLKNETLRDSLIDLAVYSMMAIVLIDENDTEDKIIKLLRDYSK